MDLNRRGRVKITLDMLMTFTAVCAMNGWKKLVCVCLKKSQLDGEMQYVNILSIFLQSFVVELHVCVASEDEINGPSA